MSKKKILTIQCELSAENSHYVSFDSETSMLDWDIIVFNPDIDDFISYTNTYQGKPSLCETDSFRLRERGEHWRREISEAFKTGKTIFVILNELQEVFVDTGERRYSGTGRNQKVTTIVADYCNYNSIPIDLKVIKANGKEMKLAPKNSDILASYWKELESLSEYRVLLKDAIKHPCILTKKGDKLVGAIIRSKDSNGAVILLPYINFYKDTYYKQLKSGLEWSKEGLTFGAKYTSILVGIDKALKSSSDITPMPEWVKNEEYILPKESKISQQLLKLEHQFEKIQTQKQKALEKLSDAIKPKALLYEKGKPLEYAIIEALNLLGFQACSYRDSDSEFDVVFECNEGRFLGEAEGKDSKPISIGKLRQLEMNIHEDFDREEISDIAKGVLLGNACRLQPLEERGNYFTEKCIKAANRSNVALIRTPDLFIIAKYLSKQSNKRFATKCRRAILKGVGIINFPLPPEIKMIKSESVIEGGTDTGT